MREECNAGGGDEGGVCHESVIKGKPLLHMSYNYLTYK